MVSGSHWISGVDGLESIGGQSMGSFSDGIPAPMNVSRAPVFGSGFIGFHVSGGPVVSRGLPRPNTSVIHHFRESFSFSVGHPAV